jgi:hypothetical protein
MNARVLKIPATVRLLPILLLLVLPAAVQAQFTYTTANNQITITKYTGTAVVDCRVVQAQHNRPIVVVQRFARILQLEMQVAAQLEVLAAIRFQEDQSVRVLERVSIIGQSVLNPGSVKIVERSAGIVFDGLGERSFGLFPLAGLFVAQPVLICFLSLLWIGGGRGRMHSEPKQQKKTAAMHEKVLSKLS